MDELLLFLGLEPEGAILFVIIAIVIWLASLKFKAWYIGITDIVSHQKTQTELLEKLTIELIKQNNELKKLIEEKEESTL